MSTENLNKYHANYYPWATIPPASDRLYRFVYLKPDGTGAALCTQTSSIYGVTVDTAGFIGGTPSENQKDNYCLVVHSGIAKVYCGQSPVSVGDYVISGAGGIAQKSEGSFGYRVVSVTNEQGNYYANIKLGVSVMREKDMVDSVTQLQTGLESISDTVDDIEPKINEVYEWHQEPTCDFLYFDTDYANATKKLHITDSLYSDSDKTYIGPDGISCCKESNGKHIAVMYGNGFSALNESGNTHVATNLTGDGFYFYKINSGSAVSRDGWSGNIKLPIPASIEFDGKSELARLKGGWKMSFLGAETKHINDSSLYSTDDTTYIGRDCISCCKEVDIGNSKKAKHIALIYGYGFASVDEQRYIGTNLTGTGLYFHKYNSTSTLVSSNGWSNNTTRPSYISFDGNVAKMEGAWRACLGATAVHIKDAGRYKDSDTVYVGREGISCRKTEGSTDRISILYGGGIESVNIEKQNAIRLIGNSIQFIKFDLSNHNIVNNGWTDSSNKEKYTVNGSISITTNGVNLYGTGWHTSRLGFGDSEITIVNNNNTPKLVGTWTAADGLSITSDRNAKHDIESLDQRYDILFDCLTARSFKYNHGTSDRTHTGFIFQEARDAALASGLTEKDFAALVTVYNTDDQGNTTESSSLRYSEFIALNTDQIQKLKKRVEELEAKIADLLQE